MAEALIGALAFAVFAVLWLSTQPWFDILPRRVTRRIGLVGVLILAGTAWLVPSAFQEGTQRYIDSVTSRVQSMYMTFMEGVLDGIGPTLSPSAVPVSPAPVPGAPETTP